MSSIYSSASNSYSNSREKGVRRPLGQINVNSADTTNKNKNSSGSKSVVKQGHQKKMSLASSEPSSALVFRSNNGVVKPSGEATPTLAFCPQAPIFRDPAIDDTTPRSSDMLSLKRANPISEAHSESQDDIEEDDYSALSFPFTRADQTVVYEPFDTMQLRSIFRTPFMHTPDLEERLEKEGLALRLANAISELDERCESSEDGSLPSLLSSSDNSSGRRTQALEWRGLVPEGTAILDLML